MVSRIMGIVTASSIMVAACNFTEAGAELPEMCSITISGDAGQTRSSSSAWESNIDDSQLLVFDPDGNLVEYSYASGKRHTVGLYAGWEYDIYMVANSVNDLSDVSTVDDLMGLTARADDSRRSHLEMIGHTGPVMMRPGSTVRVPLERIVAKLSIERISVSFDRNDACCIPGGIEWVSLMQVPTTCYYTFQPVPLSWRTKQIVNFDPGEISFSLVDNEAYNTGNQVYTVMSPLELYSFPDEDAPKSLARYVGIKCMGVDVVGNECWHCIRFRIPSMYHNRCYVIRNLNIVSLERTTFGLNQFIEIESRSAVRCDVLDAEVEYEMDVVDWTTGKLLEHYGN